MSIGPAAAELHAQGIQQHMAGNNDAALELIRRALDAEAETAAFQNSFGVVLAASGKMSGAVEAFRRTLVLEPSYASALVNLANTTRPSSAGDALTGYRRALAALGQDQTGMAAALANVASILFADDALDEATIRLKQAIALNPRLVEAWLVFARTRREFSNLNDAICFCRRAIAMAPGLAEAHWNLSLLLLSLDQYLAGFGGYEWRWRLKPELAPKLKAHPAPQWTGEDLMDRRILVQSEQGAGDVIQFSRFIRVLRRRGGRPILACPRPLLALMSRCEGIEAVAALEDEFPDSEIQVPLMSLGKLLNVTPESLPGPMPYLRADAARADSWRQRLQGGGPAIGLVWQGSPTHPRDRHRSLSIEMLAPLIDGHSGRFYSLQRDHGRSQLLQSPLAARVVDLAPYLTDYAETAAIVSACDLVISVDTSVAHLAGALAKPVWILLDAAGDWRWGRGNERTFWYPDARLFRQRQRGDWTAPISALRARLRSWPAIAGSDAKT